MRHPGRLLVATLLAVAPFLLFTPAASADPPTLTATLTIDRTGTVDRAGNATVIATVTCNTPATDFGEWFVEIGQRYHGLIFAASDDGDLPNVCGPTPTTFGMPVSGDGFGFVIKPGPITATVEVQVCDAFTCAVADATRTVILHPTRK